MHVRAFVRWLCARSEAFEEGYEALLARHDGDLPEEKSLEDWLESFTTFCELELQGTAADVEVTRPAPKAKPTKAKAPSDTPDWAVGLPRLRVIKGGQG